MTQAARRLTEDAAALRVTRAAEGLSAWLGCSVTPYALHPGTFEARGLPGIYTLVGTPEDVADEGRRVLMAQWYAVLGTL